MKTQFPWVRKGVIGLSPRHPKDTGWTRMSQYRLPSESSQAGQGPRKSAEQTWFQDLQERNEIELVEEEASPMAKSPDSGQSKGQLSLF